MEEDKPTPGGDAKGTLERMTGDAIAEMGQSVREEHSAEEVRHIVVPAHEWSFLVGNGSKLVEF